MANNSNLHAAKTAKMMSFTHRKKKIKEIEKT